MSSSSSESRGESEYVVHEREYRRERRVRDDSPESEAPRYESFRYVEAASPEPERYERYSRRERSRSREVGGRTSYRETREREYRR